MKVLFCPSDPGGCGYYRITQVFIKYLSALQSSVMPIYLGRQTLQSAGQDVTYTQRICGKLGFDELRKFKAASKSKIIIDYDDLLWDPDNSVSNKYNMFLNRIDLKSAYKDMSENLSDVADAVSVSCDALKDSLKQFYPEDRIFVLPNRLSFKDFAYDRTLMIPTDDVFFYSGSQSHYSNSSKMYGDFSIPLANLLKTAPTIFMGDVPPWFFANCVYHENWADLSVYSTVLYQTTRNAKFTLAPLVDNKFNKYKSDLKYLESCAIGRICLVGDFPGSPYQLAHPMQKVPQNASIDEIKGIIENCKAHYGELLDYQYEYLNRRWLDTSVDDYDSMFESVL